MEELTIEKLLDKVKEYNDDCDVIENCYNYAKLLHEGQYRQSGEPYITHPLM